MGGLMIILWIIRFFVFNLYESPKYLMGRGRDAEAIEVLEKVATYNGSTNRLTLEQLRKTGVVAGTEAEAEGGGAVDGSIAAAVRRNLRHLNGEHVKPLFATGKLALLCWSFCGPSSDWRSPFIMHSSRTSCKPVVPTSVMVPSTSPIEM